MDLPFLDRHRERARLTSALDRHGGLLCVYGRRRLGKSRLVQEVLEGRRSVYYVGDDRAASLQRESVAEEVSRQIPGFAEVTYRDWDALFARFYREAPERAVLTIDEFPSVVRSSPELPSIIQKHLDSRGRRDVSIIVCGSSQRMMHGLVLDAGAPLYGRAREILKIEPLEVGWVPYAFKGHSAHEAVLEYAVWGGVPRYWELACDYASRAKALRELVLEPLGVLHREPERLILDDVQEVAQTASVLALIGVGCHRLTEIAGRIGAPATSLTRPVARLIDLGLVRRDVPFGEDPRRSKRGLYRLEDPFLRFYFRVVEPARSALAGGRVAEIEKRSREILPHLVASTWEDLARLSAPKLEIYGQRWSAAARWWGNTPEGQREIDLVALSETHSRRALVGEVKLSVKAKEVPKLVAELEQKAKHCPALHGYQIEPMLWVLGAERGSKHVVSAAQVVKALT